MSRLRLLILARPLVENSIYRSQRQRHILLFDPSALMVTLLLDPPQKPRKKTLEARQNPAPNPSSPHTGVQVTPRQHDGLSRQFDFYRVHEELIRSQSPSLFHASHADANRSTKEKHTQKQQQLKFLASRWLSGLPKTPSVRFVRHSTG